MKNFLKGLLKIFYFTILLVFVIPYVIIKVYIINPICKLGKEQS